MWKFYTFVVLVLVLIYPEQSNGQLNRNSDVYFFPGFPFPEGINFPNSFFPSIPNLMRRRPSRPRPRPRPDDRERCPDEGIKLISHPRDCERYILCVDGEELTELTCPGGLHFSRITRSCVDPRAAGCEPHDWECPDTDEPGNVVFIPNEDDCTSYFLCWGGVPIPMNCAPGLHWSIFENTCMEPNEANCIFPFHKPVQTTERSPIIDVTPAALQSYGTCPNVGVVNIPNPSSCEEFFLCINGVRLERQCQPNLHFSPELAICVPPEIAGCVLSECPSTGLAFLPHEDDCNAYYICFNGVRNLMRCPGDLHWSTETNRCMDPDEAGCEENDGHECPEVGIEQIPYPDDCERFILCINGNEIPMSCSPGLHFSPTLRTCMPPQEAECEENVWSCPEENTPGVIVFIPNPEDCNSYFLCWDGHEIPLRCPSGQHWSISENRCLPPDQAECPFDDDEAEECPDEGVIAIAHPESCEKYILCVNGHEVERNCPHGMHFSREIRNCAHPLVANCVIPTRFELPANGDSCPPLQSTNDVVFMPNRNDCSSYYLCIKDESKLFTCAKGLHFDVNNRRCMKQDKAHCIAQ